MEQLCHTIPDIFVVGNLHCNCYSSISASYSILQKLLLCLHVIPSIVMNQQDHLPEHFILKSPTHLTYLIQMNSPPNKVTNIKQDYLFTPNPLHFAPDNNYTRRGARGALISSAGDINQTRPTSSRWARPSLFRPAGTQFPGEDLGPGGCGKRARVSANRLGKFLGVVGTARRWTLARGGKTNC